MIKKLIRLIVNGTLWAAAALIVIGLAVNFLTPASDSNSALKELSATHNKAAGGSPASIELLEPNLPAYIGQNQICRATIAAIFGRSPGIIKTEIHGNDFLVSYNRPDDGKRWQFLCKLSGDEVFYSGLDKPGGPFRRPGERFNFSVDGETVTIRQDFYRSKGKLNRTNAWDPSQWEYDSSITKEYPLSSL